MNTKVYGHRGCMGTYPENTLVGFMQAIRQGVDGIELDVHMTKDGEIVVIHDEFLDRTTDGTGFIKDMTLAEIRRFSAGVRFSHYDQFVDQWRLEQVPTLQEVLILLKPYAIELNIELKTTKFTYKGIEEAVHQIVQAYGNNRKVIYSSFHLPTLLRMKRMDPNADIALLTKGKLSHPHEYMECFHLEAIHISKDAILNNVTHWKALLPGLRAWTVNDTNDIKQLLDLRVSAIITDFPEKAVFYRSERKSFV
ncbi:MULTISPECIES: glycerophosphodiester phosphodiesterase [Clostridia]|uniref:glycerophosphodiester phosphodiesterase n=1 Tax=Clostridia TaxID=186801 RepID=UPI000EA248A6|nr:MULTISPECIES: glycerophosphodiester phosphodiesterase [Clostridia]NBJ70430.1 glycerophosphodiester phosphodiesterase [Roseburia sp. 1XD42-34]RKI76256.1 glycerophosphodiester phosphodiesterase [Clostridium sp. 1xD42-85]